MPASEYVPKWYKDIPVTADKKGLAFRDGISNASIRKCVPFLDAMTAGYIIQLSADVFITQDLVVDQETKEVKSIPYYSWGYGTELQFHSPAQVPGHPMNTKEVPVPKFMSNWAIFTPPGYSCMFVHPLNRTDLPFRIMDGIVDTDTYHTSVNFPFTLKDPNFTGLIKAGTPIAQIIPFKRDSWRMKSGSDEHERKVWLSIRNLRSRAFNGYRKYFWSKKDFK